MSKIELHHRRGTSLVLIWSYGPDLTDIEIVAVVSSPIREIGRLKVLRRDHDGERTLMATAAETLTWPIGLVAIDITLRRGLTVGRLDTFFIGIMA